jgi:acyl-CoA synthetase (AMP-forming)/AMP-acid ligase II
MRLALNLGEIVAAHARLSPRKIGTRDSRRALTFAQWNARACKLANALLALGLKKGDRVALLAYNRVEWMEIYIGLAKAGLVAVPVNFRLVTPEIKYIAEHCEARALIVQEELASQVEGLYGTLTIPDKAWIHIGASTPQGWTEYEALIAGGADREPGVDVKPTDTCADVHVRHDRQTQGCDPQPPG